MIYKSVVRLPMLLERQTPEALEHIHVLSSRAPKGIGAAKGSKSRFRPLSLLRRRISWS